MSLAEADYGMTSMAMDNARFHGDEHLLVRFFTHPRLDQQKSADEGRPIYADTHYVQIMQPGNKDSIVIRPATEMDKNRFAEHYKKFLAREDQEGVVGTRLDDWPGITRSQCEELKYLNVLTVEQLANISDSNAQNVMGIAFLKQKAANYLESSKDQATADALQSAQDEIAALKEQMAALIGGGETTPEKAAIAPPGDSSAPAGEDEPKPKRRRRTAAKD